MPRPDIPTPLPTSPPRRSAERDPAEIAFTLGIKATIRDSEAEADRARRAAMERNRTPLADVADDDTFWNGTPEQLTERLAPYVELGFRTPLSEQPAPMTSRRSSA